MKEKESAFDQLLKVIGQGNPPLKEDDYRLEFHQHAILKKMPSIGPCFFMVCDIPSLKVLRVSEGSMTVTGFTPDEIVQTGIHFHRDLIHPQDLEQCLQLVKISWQFLNDLPYDQKLRFVNNFYYRAVKKDGTEMKVQHQAIPLQLDTDGNILLDCHIITDISHLNLSGEVKLSMVNPEKNTCFTTTAQAPGLVSGAPMLTRREVEILKLIMKGLSSRQIAEQLYISYYTVRTHRKNLLKKVGTKNTAELIRYVLFHQLA